MDLVNESPRVLGNRYEVGDLLGRGGMAEVHLGRDTRLGRTVAIKLLRVDLARDPTFQARFRREAQSAAALNHPAIVAVYDTGEEQIVDSMGTVVALPYIVMEFVEGRTLRDLLIDGRPIDIGYALDITGGVLSALEYSHRAGIVHRDIKPANVMIGPRGEIKVMDFGIARALADASATMTQTQAVIGTAQYLSPEQARGETVDARSDLYSAGCLLFELITGRPPFVADSPVAVAYQHVREAPRTPSTYNPAVPESVDRVVMHALSKDRENRYQSALEFRNDVEAARTGRRVSAFVPEASPDQMATEYLAPAPASTRTMAPQGGGYGPAGGSMLPGAPVGEDPDRGYSARREHRPQKKRAPAAGYAVLAVAVIVVFGLIAYGVAKVMGGSGGSATTKVQVPSVSGLTQQAAQDKLQASGLTWTITQAPSATVDKGIVMDQNPAQGVTVDSNSKVTLTVSTGANTTSVPDVSGQSQQDARDVLTNEGLVVGNIMYQDDPTVPKDKVIKTNPPKGTTVDKGSTVDIYLSSGEVTVPDLTGKTLNAALSALRAQNLNVQTTFQPSDQPANTVIGQDVKNSKVAQGSTVTLTVSSGAPTPTTTLTPSPTTTLTPSPTTSPTAP